MKRRAFLTGVLSAAVGRPQQEPPAIAWVCPMDPDVRAKGPSKCPRCGMALVAGIPDPREFHVDLTTTPLRAGNPTQFRFRVIDPKTRKPAKLQVIHEKLFHLFLVSGDLSYFAHEHPVPQADGAFTFWTTLPKTGEYRVLCDFYPENATPQLIARTIVVPGPASHEVLRPDTAEQQGENMRVRLRTEPVKLLAGTKAMLFFELDPFEGLEQYLGAWGHMLAASSDLIDMIHAHPAWEDVRKEVQFNIIFPRPGMHRIWVQFQQKGVVNTVAFNVPVSAI